MQKGAIRNDQGVGAHFLQGQVKVFGPDFSQESQGTLDLRIIEMDLYAINPMIASRKIAVPLPPPPNLLMHLGLFTNC